MRNIIQGLSAVFIILSFSCSKELSVQPDSPPPLAPDIKVYIDSRPSGAKVYLNNKNTGYVTPDTVRWIEKGSYLLTLKLPYYNDTNIVISIPSESKFLDFNSNPNMMGNLNINSIPREAEIYLNDSATSQLTPYQFDRVVPGIYKIKVKKSGFRDGTGEIILNSKKTVYSVVQLTDTALWVTYNSSNSGAPFDNMTSIDMLPGGTIVAGTWGNGVMFYDQKQWTVLNSSNSALPSDYINRVKAGPDGSVWIGTDRGAAVYRNNSLTLYTQANSGLMSSNITSFDFRPDGGVWIGSSAGLHLFSNGSWSWFSTHNSPFTVPTVADLAVHPVTGDLWIALYGGGVLKYTAGGTWRAWEFSEQRIIPSNSEDEYLLTPNIQTIEISSAGEIWIGMKEIVLNNVKYEGGTGLFVPDSSKWLQFVKAPGSEVENIFFDQNNTPWFCHGNLGLSKRAEGRFVTYTNRNSGIGNNSINEGISKNGIIWLVSGGGGLIKYKGNM